MAITEGAKKAHKQSLKRRVFNLRRSRTMKEVVKETMDLVEEGKAEEARKKLPLAYQAIDKAAKRGIIKKQTAARRKARIAKAVNVL